MGYEIDLDENRELLFQIYLNLKLYKIAKKQGDEARAEKIEREIDRRIEGYENPVFDKNGKRIPYKGSSSRELEHVFHFCKWSRNQ